VRQTSRLLRINCFGYSSSKIWVHNCGNVTVSGALNGPSNFVEMSRLNEWQIKQNVPGKACGKCHGKAVVKFRDKGAAMLQ
jgi:hypothetical protein